MRPSGIKFHYFSGRSDAIVFIGRRRIKRRSFPLQSPPQEHAIQISLFSPEISSPWREALLLFGVWPFACAFLAVFLGFCFFALVFLSRSHRAFAAALIFALASAESVRRFCGAATPTAGSAAG